MPSQGMPRAPVELEDPARHVVEEVAVVGDRDDGALELGQVALQPPDALGVEVVGRLVEQQHVGLLQQQPAERHAAPLAARELGHVGVARGAAGGRPSRSRSCGPAPRAPSASIRSWSFPCFSSSRFISSSSIGSANFALISLNWSSSACCSAPPPSTLPRTSFAGSSCGSCGRKPILMPGAGPPRRGSPCPPRP